MPLPRATVWRALSIAVTVMGQAVSVGLLARRLGPSGLGSLTVLLGLAATAQALTSAGAEQVALRFLPTASARGLLRLTASLVSVRVAGMLLLGGVVAATANGLGRQLSFSVWVVIALAIAQSAYNLVASVLNASHQWFWELASTLSLWGVVVSRIYSANEGVSASAAAVTYTIGYFVAAALGTVALLIARISAKDEEQSISTEISFEAIASFAMPFYLSGLLFLVLQWWDRSVVALAVSLSAAGAYFAVDSVITAARRGFGIVESVGWPVLRRTSEAERERMFVRLSGAVFWAALLTVTLLAMWGPWIVRALFGQKYPDAAVVLAALLPALLLRLLSIPVTTGLSVIRDLPRIGLYQQIIVAAVLMVTSVPAGRAFGVLGVCAAVFAAYATGWALLGQQARRHRVDAPSAAILISGAFAFGVASCLWALTVSNEPSPILVAAAMGGSVLVVAQASLKAMSFIRRT